MISEETAWVLVDILKYLNFTLNLVSAALIFILFAFVVWVYRSSPPDN